ncbi:DDE-type integrase/transposase/recombinase [Leptolyngbya sp. FACHB-711]|uniref:DDE-type integrase/transposase/recombinase n=1 Tax=Leptolyngbya sp. FACHB-711 TaxID=2692813 RepID=UPI00321FD6C6
MDETYIRISGRWCYLYRGIDEDGSLVDVRLSEKRDMEAAKAFFAQAYKVAEQAPQRVATDGHTSYPRAIAEELGEAVEHEVRDCRGNPIEQSHRGIKQRYYPTLGFGAFESAQRFCQAYDEVRNFIRPQCYMTEAVSLSKRRGLFLERVDELQVIFQPI